MVAIRRVNNKWLSPIIIDYKYIVIGYYDTEQQAKDGYNEYIKKNNLNRKLK
jgi:hypothetical protein